MVGGRRRVSYPEATLRGSATLLTFLIQEKRNLQGKKVHLFVEPDGPRAKILGHLESGGGQVDRSPNLTKPLQSAKDSAAATENVMFSIACSFANSAAFATISGVRSVATT